MTNGENHRGIANSKNLKANSYLAFCFLVFAICNSPILLLAYPSPAIAAPQPSPSHVSSIGDLTFTGVFPRIFTPNGDTYNDKAVFHFTNPQDLPITGKIYDIAGAQVADLTPGLDPSTMLLWDGKDSGGRVVPGGIYLYKIEFQGEHITGSVIVAR